MESKKILIVDDDADIRIGLNARLRASGYQTAFAQDGIGAVTVARKEEPDLILLDIGLPGGDGFVVLQRLRSMNSFGCTPVIVLTARDPESTEKRALEAGATAFFQKPADNQALLAKIAEALA
jgi:DNA-binding response OmpR family regulator